jgi:hypothetical protein
MRLVTSKRLFTKEAVKTFIEALPDNAARDAKILPVVELSSIGNLYVGYFVLYEAKIL